MANNQENSIGSITRNYLIALGLLAVLSIIAFLILLAIINTQAASAAEINISGRQRMLSQRIAFFSHLLVHGVAGVPKSQIRNNLKKAINLMARQHNGLINGDERLRLPPLKSPKIRALFFKSPVKLDSRVRQYLSKAKKVSTAPPQELTPDNPDVVFIQQASFNLLQSLDKVVAQFQIESEAAIRMLLIMQAVALGAILLLLVLEGFIIFKPMASRIKEETRKLLTAYEEERSIAATLQKSLVPQKNLK